GDGRDYIGPYSIPGESRLGQYSPSQQAGELKAHDRQHRKQAISETVAVEDRPLFESPRSGGGDVLLAERFQHVASGYPQEDGRDVKPEGRARKYQVPHCVDELAQVSCQERINGVQPRL